MKKILKLLLCLLFVLFISNVKAEELKKGVAYDHFNNTYTKYQRVQITDQYHSKADDYWGNNFYEAFADQKCIEKDSDGDYKVKAAYYKKDANKRPIVIDKVTYNNYVVDSGCFKMPTAGINLNIVVNENGYINTSYGENYYYLANLFGYISFSHNVVIGSEIRPIFCLDPVGASPTGTRADADGTTYSGGNKLEVDRFLYEDNSYLAEDYAKSTILSSSPIAQKISEKNGAFALSYDEVLTAEQQEDWKEYTAVSMALRMFSNGVLHDILPYSFGDTEGQHILYQFINTLAHWAKEDKTFNELYTTTCNNVKATGLYKDGKNAAIECNISNYAQHLKSKQYSIENGTYYLSRAIQVCTNNDIGREGGYCDKDNTRLNEYVKQLTNGKENEYDGYWDSALISTKTYGSYGKSADDIITKAKKYLIAGMNAYNSYTANEVTTPTVEVKEAKQAKSGDSNIIVVSVKFSNFTNDDSSKFTIDSYSTPLSNTLLLGYNEDGSTVDYKPISNKNIYKLAGNNKTVYLVFSVKRTGKIDNNGNCDNKLTIQYSYDDKKLYSGALLKVHGVGDGQKYFQRFLTFTSGVADLLEVKFDQCAVCEPYNTFSDNCTKSTSLVSENGHTYVKAVFEEGRTDSGAINIGQCIIGNSDVKGNSYAVAEYEGNPYCQAYCKEDLEIKMPYKLESHAGRKIDLDVYVTGKQSCYAIVNYNAYNSDHTRTTAEKDAYMDKCNKLDVEYKFNPKINYEYEEFAIGTEGRGGVMEMRSKNETQTNTYYTNSDFKTTSKERTMYLENKKTVTAIFTTPRKYYINHNLNGLISVYAPSTPLSQDFLDKNDVVDGLPISITTASGTYEYHLKLNDIGTYYNQSSKELGRIFGNINSLATYEKNNTGNDYACTYDVDKVNVCIENGETKYCDPGMTQEECDAKYCPNAGHVSNCIREKGTYYVCDSNKYVNDSTICRKYGSSESDRLKAIEDAEKDGGVNLNCCPNCKIQIIPSCPACIIINGGNILDYRTVSKANLDPNNTIGYNWNQNNAEYPKLAIKAKYAISEIQTSEERKFNESDTSETKLSESYLLRVEMTQNMAEFIKKYNKTINNSKDGSYINSSMICKDYIVEKSQSECTNGYVWDGNHCVIDNILCYSSFVDELVDEFESQISFGIEPNGAAKDVRERLKDNKYAFEDYKVPGELGQGKYSVKSNGYWTIFPEFVNENYVGPSWK